MLVHPREVMFSIKQIINFNHLKRHSTILRILNKPNRKITLLGWVWGGDENCLASQLLCSVDICPPNYTLPHRQPL